MESKTRTIVITGAESTGKSELSQLLSSHYGMPCLPEFAREYVENLKRPYNYSDVETIALKQIQQFDEMKEKGYPLLFIDTWLIITKIWFEEVYDKVPGWLEPEIIKRKVDLFLVCDTDLPWIPDNVRENGGEKRKYLQQRYLETIIHYGFQYEIVNGKYEKRFNNAVRLLVQAGIIKPIET